MSGLMGCQAIAGIPGSLDCDPSFLLAKEGCCLPATWSICHSMVVIVATARWGGCWLLPSISVWGVGSLSSLALQMTIKRLLMFVEMALQGTDQQSGARKIHMPLLLDCLKDYA